jgi:hypothetical protein
LAVQLPPITPSMPAPTEESVCSRLNFGSVPLGVLVMHNQIEFRPASAPADSLQVHNGFIELGLKVKERK